MKLIKNAFKKTVVLILLMQIILSCIGSGISYGYTKEEVAAAVGGFAAHVVETYGKSGTNVVEYSQPNRYLNPIWKPESYQWTSSKYYFDCSSFANGCYKYVAGMDIPAMVCSKMVNFPSPYPTYFEEVPASSWGYNISNLQTGDLCVWSEGAGNPNGGHTMIFVSSDKGFAENGKGYARGGGASASQSYVNQRKTVAKGFHVFRVSDSGAAKVTNLITDYSTEFQAGSGLGSGTGITTVDVNYSEFYFNGIPDGRYSLAERQNIFQIIVGAIKDLLNFLVGLLTYLFRGLIISIISVFDRLLNNTIQSMNDAPVGLEESGTTATSADDPISMNRSVSIEQIVFNDIDLFDIDIFKTTTTTTEE